MRNSPCEYVKDSVTQEIQVKGPWHDEHGDRFVACDPPSFRLRTATPTVINMEIPNELKMPNASGEEETRQFNEFVSQSQSKPAERVEESVNAPDKRPLTVPKFTPPSKNLKASDVSTRRSARSSKGT